MGKLITAVEQYLENDDWNYEKIEDKDIIKAWVKGKNASYRLFFQAREDNDRLLVYAVSESNIPEEKRGEIAEFITRANYGLQIGNFEMDMDDGQIRYKVSVDVEGSSMSNEMVRNMILVGVTMIDRYFPGLMSVSFAGISAKDAIAQIEE
jgi:hypothetical protein